MVDQLLGRNVQHDARSLQYPAPSTGVTVKNVAWTVNGPVLDQGATSSCTGNAMAAAVNAEPIYKAGATLLTEVDALELYALATQLDDIPDNTYNYSPADGTGTGVDQGSSGLGVAKAAVQKKLISSYQHAFGFDHALAALMTGPLIVGTNWYESMMTPDANGLVGISGSVMGGHEYLLYGVDTSNKLLWFRNSWSDQWGKAGTFSMTYDTFTQLLNEQGDVILPVK